MKTPSRAAIKSPSAAGMNSPPEAAMQSLPGGSMHLPPEAPMMPPPTGAMKSRWSGSMKVPAAVVVLRDLLPALAMVAVVAVVMSRLKAITELHGKLPTLLGVGVAGVLIAVVVERFALAPAPTQTNTRAGIASLPDRAQYAAPQVPPVPQPQQSPQPKRPDITSGPMLASIADNNASMTWNLSGVDLTPPLTVSVAKLGSKPDENEDSFALDLHRGRFVVSDGASSSFASAAWSRALCSSFLAMDEPWATEPRIKATIEVAAQEWTRNVTPVGEAPWWAQEGLRKGAFATLLVVELRVANGDARWRAVAIGDSCLFHLRLQEDQWALVTSFPMAIGAQFDSYPDLVQSNEPQHIAGLKAAKGDFLAQDILMLATDAVSEWMLKAPENTWFVASSTEQQIAERFVALRETNEMVNDDATVIRIRRPLR